MSLSEQIQRVDGSQNDILRALAQSYGINTTGLKIDQIATAVKASKKFKQDGLLSTATSELFGLGADATPDDVFKKLHALDIAKTIFAEGSYVGTGTYGTENPNKLTLSGRPKLLCILDTFYRQGLIVPLYTESEIISPSFLPAVWDSKPIVFSVSGNTVSWHNATDAVYQMNESGRTYYYKVLL